MSEVGAADRSRLLRSKRAELSGIVTSRKRKLREFFAVCDNDGPIPQINLSNVNAPPTNAAEAYFLEVTDILQDRLFDESNLPTRRQLRSDTLKQRSPIRKASPDVHPADASRKAGKVQRDGSRSRKSRATTPSARSDGGTSTTAEKNETEIHSVQATPMSRSASKGSQTDLPVESAAVLDEIVEETFENATQPEPLMQDEIVHAKDLESDRIRTVLESRPNSPGVDPRQALPILAEDAANLPGPIVEGLGSHDGQYKAVTAHLPPREVQEQHLREADKEREQREGREHLSIHPPRDGARITEALSSPGSTVDAHSATTPAMHEASTDTSPDNESRYDAERMETNEEEPKTPPELRPSPGKVAEKEEHDRILQAQIDIARNEILKSDSGADEEDQEMEEQAVVETHQQLDDSQAEVEDEVNDEEEMADGHTNETREDIQDAVEDDDEVVGVPTSEEEETPEVEAPSLKEPEAKEPEVPDSDEEERTPPVDAMDVDTTTVKDSFESSVGLDSRPPTSPPAPETAESVESVKLANEPKKAAVTSAAPTPRRTPPTPAPAPPTLERMTTRVSSGAMRHKSVSEILGETPKQGTSSSSERSPAKEDSQTGTSHSPSRSSTPQSPSARMRLLAEKAKERSKLSTVVFPGKPPKPASQQNAVATKNTESSKEDYFMPLFLATVGDGKRGFVSLDSLLASAHKTITTSNAYVPILENQTAKVLKRIYNLQSSNKWSLRQPKRAPEPVRPTSHWDVVLQEAKWMRTDFREERKWKMTVARNLAYACAEWVESTPEDRRFLQVKATPPKPEADVEMAEASSQDHPTPELVASGEFDSPMDDLDDEPRLNLMETVAPTAIFALQDDDVVFGLRRSPTTDKLLDELPMYGAPLRVPQSDLPTSDLDPDRFWRREALPLSKYVEGRMVLKQDGPPRKRSRFEYEEEDDDEDQVVFGEAGPKKQILEPEMTEVALFNPEHKHIRERIHNSHQFRPPSEFPMPLQSFFENRAPSQWTYDEDNDLKNHVREFSYNWSLISSMLQSKSLYSSGAERRTPWECFERWIHLEGLPADMVKTHYFRAYTLRIETANRNVMAQAQQMQQQAGPNGQPPPRRRPTTSVRVERRRNQKHLTLVDAMRKLAKKRETNAQKQQHAQGMAAMRKANEVPQQVAHRQGVQTPQDFSRIKAEREEAMRERMAELQRRQDANRRLQRTAAQNPQQAGLPNGVPQQRAAGALAPNSTPVAASQNLTVPGQNRPPRPMPPQMAGQPMPNGLRVPQLPMNGVPQAPMQGQMPLPNPALDVGLVARAHQVSQHQQAILRQQQGQMPGQSPQMHNSPPRMNGMPAPGFPMPNGMMPPFNPNGNGGSSSPGGHMPTPGQAGSPRMGQNLLQQNNVSHVQILEHQIKSKFPQATQEQVMRMISDQLAKSVHQVQQRQGIAQSAMNAAAGGVSMNGMGPAAQATPQLYAQMLRQQQENQLQQKQAQAQAQAAQQAANAVVNGNAGNASGNAGQGHAHRGSSGSVQSGK